jgi:hypothetical protein
MSANSSRSFGTASIKFSNAKGMRRTIGRTSGERGRKFTFGRRDSTPSVGLVLKRSSTRGYTAEHPTDIKRLATSSCPRVERVQQVQRRCPWARAMIASPYIRQLRYGLPLCCIHGQSRGKDGAHLHNGRLARPNLRWFSAATHPTRPTPTRRSVGTVSL